MWKIKNFELEGKIVIFKTIATSKIVFQLLIKTFSKQSVNEFKKHKRDFSGKTLLPRKNIKLFVMTVKLEDLKRLISQRKL